MSHNKPTTLKQEADMYPNAIQEALDNLDEERTNILKQVENAEFADSMATEFSNLEFDVYCSTIGKELWVTVKIEHIDEVFEIIRWLGRHGQRQSILSFDVAENRQRCWCFAAFMLCAQFGKQEDGATCRFVQTGTKTVPVMELVCSEGDVT